MRVVALQTARANSKGVPKKNTINIAGLPLYAWNLKQLFQSELIDDIYFSTDIPDIPSVRKNIGYKRIERPPELALDNSSHYDAMYHGVQEILKDGDFDIIVLTLGNSWGAVPEDVDKAIQFLIDNPEYDSCESVSKHNWHNPSRAYIINHRGDVESYAEKYEADIGFPDTDWNDRNVRGDIYFFNGSFFVVRKNVFLDNNGMIPFTWRGTKVHPIIQSPEYMELDEEWQIAIFNQFS